MSKKYILLPAKPVLVFEVFLPKRPEYFAKLAEVLDSFLDVQRLRAVAAIRKIINVEKTTRGFDEEQFLKDISEVISGYSIYEVDGRFRGNSRPVDERVLVIRFIIHDPLVEGGMRDDLIERGKEVIRYLITRRFAEELGIEDEIWFVEYQNCWLQRWVKRRENEH